MRDKVRPDKLREAVEQALLRFPHMMLTAEPTETAFRYRRNVQPAVVLPFDGVSTRYTIGSKDTNGYLFLVGYHDKTIYMEYQHSISDGRGFEEFIRCVLFQYLKNCGFPVENDGSVRGMDTRWSPEESANGYEQLADREFSPDGIWKKPEAVHAPEVQWGADSSEVVTEVTFPFSQLHDYAKSIGVSPLSVLAPLMMKAFDDNYDTPICAGTKVAVVGGGNVAMDAARTALRLGAEVHIVYRRSEEELPARVEEVHHAKEEGIIFDLLTNPKEILVDDKGNVTGMKVIKMELGEPDASGRRRPVEVPGSEFVIDVDTVIMSLGTSPNPLISSTTEGLEINKWKCIVADEESGKTSQRGRLCRRRRRDRRCNGYCLSIGRQ